MLKEKEEGEIDDSSSPSSSGVVVLLELTPADDSRDLRFLGVASGSVVRVSRRKGWEGEREGLSERKSKKK